LAKLGAQPVPTPLVSRFPREQLRHRSQARPIQMVLPLLATPMVARRFAA